MRSSVYALTSNGNAFNGRHLLNGRHNHESSWIRTASPVLITGGAGFIGTNLAFRLLSQGQPVVVLDNLSRNGANANLQFLSSRFGKLIEARIGDVRDASELRKSVKKVSAVFHFAAQVAVTTSLKCPLEDFEVNARGTLNLLEALKSLEKPAVLLFTSTNKVYGRLESILLEEAGTRYVPRDPEIRRRGIGDDCHLDFHSPYGCSKGAADQYVLDYANNFGLTAIVFRMSCIYGTHQRGNEDQGWVAHFVSRFCGGKPLTIFGDGKQVRDLLFVDDLIDAMLLAHDHASELTGRAFNIGGGPTNAISLLELIQLLREMGIAAPEIRSAQWRAGDQYYYVSDTARFRHLTGWRAKIGIREGLHRLYQWLATAPTDPISQFSN
ncbi:MAG: NAD-dependent epimerase/dehydratase family protein [Candidatus Binataceae bacterium]|nr:NAD-dependent epimerase/dehydratase family protein [Candidatus Binataceae bacterium]